MWSTHPRARKMALEAWSLRRILHRQEAMAELGLESATKAELYHEVECRTHRSARQGRTPSMKELGLFGIDIDDESIGMVMRRSVDKLVLRLDCRKREETVMQQILRSEEIRRSMRVLQVKNAMWMTAEDVSALEGLEQAEEIEIGSMISNACLHILAENRGVAEILRRARLVIRTVLENEEAMELLCTMGIDKLNVYCDDVKAMVLLFCGLREASLREGCMCCLW